MNISFLYFHVRGTDGRTWSVLSHTRESPPPKESFLSLLILSNTRDSFTLPNADLKIPSRVKVAQNTAGWMVTTPDGANGTEGLPLERNGKEKAKRLKTGQR